MKRFIALVVLLLFLIPVFPYGATDRFGLTYTPKSENSSLFYLDIDSGCDVSAAIFELSYDDSMVSFAAVNPTAENTSVRGESRDGRVTVAFADSSSVSGALCRLSFKALQSGTTTFVLHTEQAVDGDLNALPSVSDQSLKVTFGKDEVVSALGTSSKTSKASAVKSSSSSRSGKTSSVKLTDAQKSDGDDGSANDSSGSSDVYDLRGSEPHKWLLIGAGIVVLTAALVAGGVLYGKKAKQTAQEKPGDTFPEHEETEDQPDSFEQSE